jgi:P27 family predicted phage terminase small subunit
MSTGRKPKPTALKRLAGNPGCRPLNENEPRPSGIPTCPEHLNTVAKAEWERLCGELSSLGLLTIVDRAALAAYCAVYARWADAEQKIEKHGTVIKTVSGNAIQNPYVGVANRALDLMYKFQSEFGMTPSSRSRLSVSPSSQVPAGSWDEFCADIAEEPDYDPARAN